MNEREEHGLERRLGLGAATLSGIGVIVGAGIYVLIGLAAQQAGSGLWISFLIAALGASLTGLSYSRLARIKARNAPEFRYVSEAFGAPWGFLAGWLMLWAGIVSAAAVCLGFAGYLNNLTGVPLLPGAVGLIVLCSVVAFVGIGQSVALTLLLIVPTVVGLVVITAIGIPHIGEVGLLETPNGVTGVVSAASLVFFAYIGFQSIANLSEEMKQPERDLPKAILTAIGITALLYVLVSVAAVSVLGWEGLGQAKAPLAAVAAEALGSAGEVFVSVMSLTATASTVLVLLVASSRAMLAMSCDGALPMAFCVVGKNRRTPWPAITVVALFTALLATSRSIQQVAEFTNFAILISFAGVNLAAIKLLRRGSSNRLGHIVLSVVLPALGVAMSLWLAIEAGWQAAVFGGVLVAAGVVAGVAMRVWPRTRCK